MCAELVFLCAMSPDHVLYPPDLLCSLVLLDSLLFLQVLPLLPKARILSQIVRQIVSGNTQEVVTGFFTRRQRNIPFIVKLIFLLLNLGYDCEELR